MLGDVAISLGMRIDRGFTEHMKVAHEDAAMVIATCDVQSPFAMKNSEEGNNQIFSHTYFGPMGVIVRFAQTSIFFRRKLP